MIVVDALAAYRLTRLVVEDTITVRPREALIARGPGWAGDMLTCPWCVGWWVSVGVVGARIAAPRAWRPVARALALSAIVGLIAEHT